MRACVPRIDSGGAGVRRQRILVPAGLLQDAAHGRVRARVGGIGRYGLFVPAERLVVPAEALGGLAGDHVPRGGVPAGSVRGLGGPAVEGRGGDHVAAQLRPDPAEQPEHGGERRHLIEALFYVPEHHPRHKAPSVPLGSRPVHVVVAHDVHYSRRVEQGGVVREHAHHAQLVLHGPNVVYPLNAPVEPDQVRGAEAAHDLRKLGEVGGGDAQVDGRVHALRGVEHALPDLAVEHLKARRGGDRKVPPGQLAAHAGQLLDVIVQVERLGHVVADEIRRYPAEPALLSRQRRRPFYVVY